MDMGAVLAELTANAEAIDALVRPVGADMARWRPSSDAWSILEVVCHLADEERDDFRTRVRLTLQDPTLPWPPIDPAGWVTARDYAKRDIEEALADFVAERRRSLEWLAGLDDPQWANTARHPAGFTIRAGDFLASWLAHDLLHLRQLVELRYGALAQDGAAPDAAWDVRYAGDW